MTVKIIYEADEGYYGEDSWTKIEIYTREDGTAWAEYITSDNYDRGFASGRAEWHIEHASMKQAVKNAGYTGYGVNGGKKDVYLDNKLLTHNDWEKIFRAKGARGKNDQ